MFLTEVAKGVFAVYLRDLEGVVIFLTIVSLKHLHFNVYVGSDSVYLKDMPEDLAR